MVAVEASAPAERLVPPLLVLAKATAYRFLLESSSTLGGPKDEAKMVVRGVLWLEGSAEGERFSLRAVLQDPSCAINGQPQPEFQKMVEVMAQGATFLYIGGALKETSVPSKVEPQIANLWRTLGAALQHSGRGIATGTWTVREHDSTGEYEARYRWDGDRLVRTKDAYVSVLQSGLETATVEQLRPRVQRSEASLRLAEGRLAGLRLEETIAADLQKGVTMTVTSRLELEGEAEGAFEATLEEAFARLREPTGHTTFRAEQPIALRGARVDQTAFDDLRMKEWTFEEAVQGAAKAENLAGEDQESKKEERRRVYSAYSALTAFLRSRPETHAQAKQLVLQGGARAEAIVSALGDAGTVAAQRLLMEVIQRESVPAEIRSRAIVRLARTDSPVPEVVDALAGRLGEERLWGQALLALGIAGRDFRDAGRANDFDRVSSILEEQFQEHLKAGGARLIKVLDAISNLGDRRHLQLVRPLLTSPEEELRASAAFALRHMQDDAVDPLIVRALAENPSTKSRLMILSAMRVRGPRPILREALAQLLAHEQTTGQVRTRAARLQESWEEAKP